MKNKINGYIKNLYILGIATIIGGIILNSNDQLTGFHFFENIISDGQYVFYIRPTETAYHTFEVTNFLKDANYEVYNMESNELVSSGNIGFISEGYRPFMEMYLAQGNLYKVILELEDENTYGFANIKLYLD